MSSMINGIVAYALIILFPTPMASTCTIWEIPINCLHLYLFTNLIIHSSGTGNLPYIRINISCAIILHWGRPRDPLTLMNYPLKYLPQWNERSVSQNKSIQVIVDNNLQPFQSYCNLQLIFHYIYHAYWRLLCSGLGNGSAVSWAGAMWISGKKQG